MLALMLSGVVGLASVVSFLSAFFAPKLHRKDDFLWSGFGFFYALVLWICAQRFTGAILLGQVASVGLILAFAWQTLRLRAAIAQHAIAEVKSFSVLDWLGGGFKRQPKTAKVEPQATETLAAEPAPSSPPAEVIEPQPSPPAAEVTLSPPSKPQEVAAVTETNVEIETLEEETLEVAETNVKADATEPVNPEISPTAAAPETPIQTPPTKSDGLGDKALPNRPKPKSKLFQWIFGNKKQQSSPVVNVAEAIENVEDDEEWDDIETPTTVDTPVDATATSETADTVTPNPENPETKETLEAQETQENQENREPSEVVAMEIIEVIEVVEVETVMAIATEQGETEDADEETVPPSSESEAEAPNATDNAPVVAVTTTEVENTEIETETETAATESVMPQTDISIEESVSATPTQEAPVTPIIDEEISNWDEFDEEFDPYLSSEDATTYIEAPMVEREKPTETAEISEANAEKLGNSEMPDSQG